MCCQPSWFHETVLWTKKNDDDVVDDDEDDDDHNVLRYNYSDVDNAIVFSERELKFMFAICRRPSVCRLSVVCRLSSVCLSVTFVRPTQAIDIFGNIFTPFCRLVIYELSVKILRRSSQGNPSIWG